MGRSGEADSIQVEQRPGGWYHTIFSPDTKTVLKTVEEPAGNPSMAAYILGKEIVALGGEVDEETVQEFNRLFRTGRTQLFTQSTRDALLGCRQTMAGWSSVQELYNQWSALPRSHRDQAVLDTISVSYAAQYRQVFDRPDVSRPTDPLIYS